MVKGNKITTLTLDIPVEKFSYNVECLTFTRDESMKGLMHYHHSYELLYIAEGERILWLNDDKYIMNNSHIALIPPYVFHGSDSGGSPKQVRCMISFKDCFIPNKGRINDVNLLSCFTLKHPVIKLNEDEKAEVAALTEKMELLYKTKENFYDKMSSSFYLCNLLTLCMKNQSSQNTQMSADISNMYDIIKYIEKNYYEDITQDILADKFFINKYKLSRQFKNHIGINMPKFLNKIRTSKAKEMLSDTDQKITDIAGKTGFNNTTHFNRVFKEETGCSPSEYRTQYRIYGK